MGGPDIDENRAFDSHRRSLYLRQTPDSQAEFLRIYDQPIPNDCYVRPQSIMPQQALASANDQYITSLYNHNFSKLSLARALGVARTSYNQYLGGK